MAKRNTQDRRWRLQVVSSFGRKTLRLFDDVVPRGESVKGPRDEKEEVMTKTGTATGTGIRTDTRTEMRIERRMDGSESGNLPSDCRDNRGVAEDAREGIAPTGNQKPQPQAPTLQRERCIMRGGQSPETGSEGRDRRGGRRGEEEQQIPEELRKTDEIWAAGRKSADKRALVQ